MSRANSSRCVYSTDQARRSIAYRSYIQKQTEPSSSSSSTSSACLSAARRLWQPLRNFRRRFCPWPILGLAVMLLCIVTWNIAYWGSVKKSGAIDDLLQIMRLRREHTFEVSDYTNRSVGPEDVKELTTVSGNEDIIIYNRVPKTGSTCLNKLFNALSKPNGFMVYSSKIYRPWTLNDTAEKGLVDELYTIGQPVVYDRHIFFVDFTKYGRQQPVYINVVREPMDRLMSAYYFIRTSMPHMFSFNTLEGNYTYDECVQHELRECFEDSIQGYFQIVPFHCGQDPRCHISQEWALLKAKENVQKWYPVVGLTEELDKFVEVLDRLLPKYFRNLASVYRMQANELKQIWGETKKVPPLEKTVRVMRDKMRYEYDFYFWIKQRFYKQYNIVIGT